MKIRKLLSGIDVLSLSGNKDQVVKLLLTDSRRVVPGSVFFAIAGTKTSGCKYINEAIERGAIAVVSESKQRPIDPILFVQVKEVREALANMAKMFYNFPDQSISITGITGTNGKSTVAHLLRFYFRKQSEKCGLLGTIEYDLGDRTLPAHRTTPESVDIFSMLAEMKKSACKSAVMEVSSHGINQKRIYNLEFDTAVFTNLTQDHLDYHSNMEDYFEVKIRLFNGSEGTSIKKAVINIDDPYGLRLSKIIPKGVEIVTFGTHNSATLQISKMKLDANGGHFKLTVEGKELIINSPLLGKYNVSNVTAALAVLYAKGCSLENFRDTLLGFKGVPGRMESITNSLDYTILVDYAHTPDALKNALSMLKDIISGKIILVFGCGGNRDRTKRPEMLKVAMAYADLIFLTSDNPRGESIDYIFQDMLEGNDPCRSTHFINDREKAIQRALNVANPKDCVLVAGKGHETYQEYADTIVPFDDRKVIMKLLQKEKVTLLQ